MKLAIRTLLALGTTALIGTFVAAQEPKKDQPAEAAASELQVYRLKNASAAETAALLNNLFSGNRVSARIVADPATNSLVIQGKRAVLGEIEAILSRVDIPRPDTAPEWRTRVISLGQVDPDKGLEDMIRVAMAGKQAAKFAIDRNRRSIIVTGDDATVKAIEDLLKAIQPTVKPVVARQSDVQIRVVWLVSGGKDEATTPPADLKDVLAGLAKLGIERPRLAAQTIVNVAAGSEFQASGAAKLDMSSCQFSVTGRFSDAKDAPGLQIAIRANRPSNRGLEDLGHIETKITAPIGHMVVLGVTPTDTLTSVFVVQVLRQESNR